MLGWPGTYVTVSVASDDIAGDDSSEDGEAAGHDMWKKAELDDYDIADDGPMQGTSFWSCAWPWRRWRWQ